jgi:hypothetical protein
MSGKKIKLIIAIVVLLFLVGGLVVKFYVFKKAETSVASKKADIVMESGDLVTNFENDEKSANAKYLNKIIEVKGVIDNITDTKADVTVYLKQKASTSGVVCSFDKTVFQKNTVKIGDQVSIKGICSGYLMDVVLNKCAVVK